MCSVDTAAIAQTEVITVYQVANYFHCCTEQAWCRACAGALPNVQSVSPRGHGAEEEQQTGELPEAHFAGLRVRRYQVRLKEFTSIISINSKLVTPNAGNKLQEYRNIFKYHVSCTDGKISVRINIEITFIFRLHRRPMKLVVLVPVGLSLPL